MKNFFKEGDLVLSDNEIFLAINVDAVTGKVTWYSMRRDQRFVCDNVPHRPYWAKHVWHRL